MSLTKTCFEKLKPFMHGSLKFSVGSDIEPFVFDRVGSSYSRWNKVKKFSNRLVGIFLLYDFCFVNGTSHEKCNATIWRRRRRIHLSHPYAIFMSYWVLYDSYDAYASDELPISKRLSWILDVFLCYSTYFQSYLNLYCTVTFSVTIQRRKKNKGLWYLKRLEWSLQLNSLRLSVKASGSQRWVVALITPYV